MRISVTLTNIFSVLTQCFNMFYSVHISLCGNDACKNNVQSIKFHINMCLLRQLNGSSVYHGTNRINVVFKSIIPRLTKSSITHKIRNTTTNFFSMLTLMCDRQFPQILKENAVH